MLQGSGSWCKLLIKFGTIELGKYSQMVGVNCGIFRVILLC